MSHRTSNHPRASRCRRVARSVRQRPAATAGASGSLVALITAISVHDWLAAATAAVGMLPMVWQFWKNNGGWEGIEQQIMRGDAGPATPGDGLDGAKAA